MLCCHPKDCLRVYNNWQRAAQYTTRRAPSALLCSWGMLGQNNRRHRRVSIFKSSPRTLKLSWLVTSGLLFLLFLSSKIITSPWHLWFRSELRHTFRFCGSLCLQNEFPLTGKNTRREWRMYALSCFGYTHPTVLRDHEHIYLYVLLFESEVKSFFILRKRKHMRFYT